MIGRLGTGTPRLLPMTILALASLLAMRSVELVRMVVSAVDQTASVGLTEAAQAATPPPPPPPTPAAAAVQSPLASPPAVSAPSRDAVPAPSRDAAAAPVSDGERTVLLELRRRRQELDSREAGVAARESLLAAAEQKLTARVAELRTLQKHLEELEATRKQRENASWQGLVKLYEAMKPREAAVIFNDLEMSVLLQVVDRMKETKAAPILAAMQPDKARDLTAQLAQLRERRDNPGGVTGG